MINKIQYPGAIPAAPYSISVLSVQCFVSESVEDTDENTSD
jgi:hypothetical protein